MSGLHLHLTTDEMVTLNIAARHAGVSIEKFALDSAITEAHMTLSNRSQFGLSAEKWRVFLEALDAPARPLPRLASLLKEE